MTPVDLEITAAQLRAGRALLGWNQQELARRSKVAVSTIADFERGKRSPVANNLEAIRGAFESAGVSLLPGGAVNGPPPEPQSVDLTPDGQPIRLISSTDLVQWAERWDAKSGFPELINRLILATTHNSFAQLCFPAAESIQTEGWDGICNQQVSKSTPWLPLGFSGWELATQRTGTRGKANGDYGKRTTDPRELIRDQSTFVFATLARWPDRAKWAKQKHDEGVWKNVLAIDADDLVNWIELYPSVAYWLASRMGKLPSGCLPVADSWQEWRLATKWPLHPEVTLAGRDDEAIELLQWLRASPSLRSVQADSPDDAVAFLYAAINRLPEPHRSYHLMRCLRVSNAETARTLGSSPSPLIIVMEATEPGLAAHLAQQGHHVLVAYGSAVGISEVNTVLPRPDHEAFQNTLETMGIPKEDAAQLTRESVRSLAVLRRLIPADTVKRPDWAEEPKARVLIPALLAGGWDGSRKADCIVLEQLSGRKFDAFESECTPFTEFPDAPLRHVGTTWKIASPRDAWFQLARLIGKSELDRFAAAAQFVLGSSDPRFRMNPDERWLAGVRGQLPDHSSWLLAGLSETLLLLAMFGDRVISVSDAGQYALKIVRALLMDADAQRWYSLSDELRTLAEAAPEVFLEAVEKSLGLESAPILTLFQKEGDPLFGSAKHSHLLWALETLAWSPNYLSRVSLILARLSSVPIDTRWGNRPDTSLRTIFLLWMPQTNASLAERLRVLDYLRRKEPEAAWKLMLATLPSGYDTVMPSPKPRWRDFSVENPEEVTYGAIARGAAELSEQLVSDAGGNPNRCVDLIEALSNMAPEWRKKVVSSLGEKTALIHDDSARIPIWTALRRLLGNHRSFPNAQWSLPETELQEIEQVYDKFRPADPINQRIWLFSDSVQLVAGQTGTDWVAQSAELSAMRRTALAEILLQEGPKSILRLAREAQRPHLAGFAYAEYVAESSEADEILHELIGADEAPIREFVSGLIAKMNERFGSKWSRQFLEKERHSGQAKIVEVLLALPSDKKTWNLAASFGSETNSEYWRSARIFWLPTDEELLKYGVHQLLEARRARTAVRLTAGGKQVMSTELIVRMLLQAAQEPAPNSNDLNDPVMFQWSICQLLGRLDESTDVSEAQLGQLEWIYLSLLEHSTRPPVVLHRAMSKDPALFVQVLSSAFRAHSESTTDKSEIPAEAKALAQHAYRLLGSWKSVPGTTEEGIDPLALNAWIQEAHQLAVQEDRAAIGDQYIGRVLSFSGEDPDGAWPVKAVRYVIEEMRNEHLELGMMVALHNNVGATSRGMLDGGKLERGIADRYRRSVDIIRFEWPHTASVLERIADSFEETARHQDEHAEHTDWSY